MVRQFLSRPSEHHPSPQLDHDQQSSLRPVMTACLPRCWIPLRHNVAFFRSSMPVRVPSGGTQTQSSAGASARKSLPRQRSWPPCGSVTPGSAHLFAPHDMNHRWHTGGKAPTIRNENVAMHPMIFLASSREVACFTDDGASPRNFLAGGGTPRPWSFPIHLFVAARADRARGVFSTGGTTGQEHRAFFAPATCFTKVARSRIGREE